MKRNFSFLSTGLCFGALSVDHNIAEACPVVPPGLLVVASITNWASVLHVTGARGIHGQVHEQLPWPSDTRPWFHQSLLLDKRWTPPEVRWGTCAILGNH